MFYYVMREEWEAGRGPAVAEKVRLALAKGLAVYARIDHEYDDVPKGTVVPVVLAKPTALYQPQNPDGSAVHPETCPGYVLKGTWSQIAWSGGGFWGAHTIIIP
jgi:hypothetical protein